MTNIVLNTVVRDMNVRSKDICKQNRIPAVVYGKGEENIFVDFDYQEFRKLYEQAGQNTLIDLMVDGKSVEVLVHSLQYHPVTGNFMHVDLKRITRGVEITTEIPIRFEGVSEAVKTMNGVLMTQKEVLNVKCLPKDLVHDVTADLSLIEDFNCKIAVADIPVPDSITVLNAPDEVVATVSAPRTEEEEETTTAAEGEEGAETEEKKEGEEGEETDGKETKDESKE